MSDDNGKDTREVTKIRNCARCGGTHDGPIIFEALEKPAMMGGSKWTHWAPCPTNRQPILMKFRTK